MLSRRRRHNRTAAVVTLVALGLLVTIVHVAPLRAFFAFGAVTSWELALALASEFIALSWFELLKIIRPFR